MIVTIIIKGLILVFSSILVVIPTILSVAINLITAGQLQFPVTITELPFGIDALLSTGMGYYRFVAVYIPPLEILFTFFTYAIIWKIGINFVKMIPVIRGWFQK